MDKDDLQAIRKRLFPFEDIVNIEFFHVVTPSHDRINDLIVERHSCEFGFRVYFRKMSDNLYRELIDIMMENEFQVEVVEKGRGHWLFYRWEPNYRISHPAEAEG